MRENNIEFDEPEGSLKGPNQKEDSGRIKIFINAVKKQAVATGPLSPYDAYFFLTKAFNDYTSIQILYYLAKKKLLKIDENGVTKFLNSIQNPHTLALKQNQQNENKMDKKQENRLTEVIRKETVRLLNEIKKKKKKRVVKLEGLSVEGSGTVQADEVGRFFVIINPTKDSNEKTTMFESDVFNLSDKIRNGLATESIRAIIKKEGAAKRMVREILKEREMAVFEAKKKAEKYKKDVSELKNRAVNLKKTKMETQQAVKKLNERPVPAKKK